MSVEIVLNDPGHLEAHKAEYLVALDELLGYARQGLQERLAKPGLWESFVVKCPVVVGRSGLKRLWPWTKGAFWAPRAGRTIPSHLIRGKRRKTRNLCVWGVWQNTDVFLLHTLYPGKPAPREIHDPSLKLEDVQESVQFWLQHAIITEQS
jgi:hypothetical protein